MEFLFHLLFTEMTRDNKDNISSDIEQLRNKWRRLSIEAPAPGPRPGGNRRVPHSEKQRIIRRFWTLAITGCIFMIYFAILIRHFQIPYWLTAIYELFIALTVGVNLYMLNLLKRADFAEMTTIKAITFIKRFTRLRARFKFLLTCLAIPLVILIIWVLDDGTDSGIIIGGITGAVIGGIVGVYIDRCFKKDLKTMSSILGEES